MSNQSNSVCEAKTVNHIVARVLEERLAALRANERSPSFCSLAGYAVRPALGSNAMDAALGRVRKP
jgi:hypothetical protein